MRLATLSLGTSGGSHKGHSREMCRVLAPAGLFFARLDPLKMSVVHGKRSMMTWVMRGVLTEKDRVKPIVVV